MSEEEVGVDTQLVGGVVFVFGAFFLLFFFPFFCFVDLI